jgi:hypothetical protein
MASDLDLLDRLAAEKIKKLLQRHGHNIDFSHSKHGCWEWKGCLDRDGYGRASTGGNSDARAHRLFYSTFNGPIQSGLVMDHLCRNRNCVNPDHLEPVTNLINNQRGNHPIQVAKRRGECINGHKLTTKTTYIQTYRGKKWTGCLLCRQIASAKGRTKRESR